MSVAPPKAAFTTRTLRTARGHVIGSPAVSRLGERALTVEPLAPLVPPLSPLATCSGYAPPKSTRVSLRRQPTPSLGSFWASQISPALNTSKQRNALSLSHSFYLSLLRFKGGSSSPHLEGYGFYSSLIRSIFEPKDIFFLHYLLSVLT